MARSHELPELARLEDKSRLAVDTPRTAGHGSHGDRPVGQRRATDVIPKQHTEPAVSGQGRVPSLSAYPGAPSTLDDPSARLHQAVQDADDRGAVDERVLARAALVRTVCIPRRQFREARSWSKQALSLTNDPDLCAQVLTGAWLAGVVLGDAAAAEDVLNRSAGLGDGAPADAGESGLTALRCIDFQHTATETPLTAVAALGENLSNADPFRFETCGARAATCRR